MNLDTKSKALLVAAVLLLAVGISVLTYTSRRPTPEQPPATTPSSSSSPSTSSPDKGHTTVPAANYPAEVGELAEQAILAYTQFSFRDPGPLTWMKRLEPLCTPQFAHSLEETFEGDGAAERAWKQDIQPTQHETRTQIADVQLSGLHEHTDSRYTLVVSYLTSIRTRDLAWTEPAEPLSQFVTLTRVGGAWKVSDMTSTSDRSGTAA